MQDIRLNSELFQTRLKRILKTNDTPLIIILGKSDDLKLYGLNSALFIHLLSYEFPETLIIVKEDPCIVTSRKKTDILSQLKCNIVNKKDLPTLRRELLLHKQYYIVDSSNIKGEFCNEVLNLLKKNQIKIADATENLLGSLTIKDDDFLKMALQCGDCLNKWSLLSLEYIKKEYPDINPSRLDSILDSRIFESDKIDENHLDTVFAPIVSIDKNILLKLSLRYYGVCTELTRTILVNHNKEEEKLLNVLDECKKYMISYLNSNITTFDQKKLEENVQQLFKEKCEKLEILIENKEDQSFSEESSVSSDGPNGVDKEKKIKIKTLKSPVIYTTGMLKKELTTVETKNINNIMFAIHLETHSCGREYTIHDTVAIMNTQVKLLTNVIDIVDCTIEYKLPERNKGREQDLERNIMRVEHQKQLMDDLVEEMLEFYKKQGVPQVVDEAKKSIVYPYLKDNLLPRSNKLIVDKVKFAVLIPINNFMVPFPIFAIKNTSISEDGILRINFNVGGPEDSLKSILYKGRPEELAALQSNINETKKSYQLKKDSKGIDTIKDEEMSRELELATGKRIVLPNVFIKFDMRARRAKASNLELHKNGFRYIMDNQTVTILFSNIKHLFFQAGDIESRTILHFHLYTPILLIKKTMNVQFYKDGASPLHDTTKIRSDAIEAMQEKEEEDRRRTINKEFEKFVAHIEEASPLRANIPSKAGSFGAVPFKESVYIQPSRECLVNLIESPFFILTLKEVEVVCFERVVFGIKTIDIVFIFKDKAKPITYLLTVDSCQLIKIKDYLDANNIPFIETKMNVHWNNVLKDILVNPVGFYESGGWAELQLTRADSEEEEEVVEEEEDLSTSSGSFSDGDASSRSHSDPYSEEEADDESISDEEDETTEEDLSE